MTAKDSADGQAAQHTCPRTSYWIGLRRPGVQFSGRVPSVSAEVQFTGRVPSVSTGTQFNGRSSSMSAGVQFSGRASSKSA